MTLTAPFLLRQREDKVALEDFTLLAKVFDLDVETHKIVKKFERSERHVLSAEIRQTVALVEHLLIRAAKEQLEERRKRLPPERTRELQRQMDVELEYLKLQIRKSYELRLVNETCYGIWATRIAEVGRMLGAWIKQVEAAIEKATPRHQGRLL